MLAEFEWLIRCAFAQALESHATSGATLRPGVIAAIRRPHSAYKERDESALLARPGRTTCTAATTSRSGACRCVEAA